MKKPWKYYDYCLERYSPVSSQQGKLSSDVLLKNSLEASAYQKDYLLLMREIRRQVGPWQTVWGAKLENGVLHWELYFYNHGIKEPRKTVTSLLKILRKRFFVPVFADIGIESQPYFMFSIDLNDGILKSKKLDHVNIYIQGRLGTSQANSYYWGVNGLHFENHFEFFRQPQERRQMLHKIKDSIFLVKDCAWFFKLDLIRYLMPCYQICVAQKSNKDGIYFSRVNVQQLLYFLEYFSYPAQVIGFVRNHSGQLDHMLYDVAFDLTRGPEGFMFGKSSYYGVF